MRLNGDGRGGSAADTRSSLSRSRTKRCPWTAMLKRGRLESDKERNKRGEEKNKIEWGLRVRLKRLKEANLIWDGSRRARSTAMQLHTLVSYAVRDIYIVPCILSLSAVTVHSNLQLWRWLWTLNSSCNQNRSAGSISPPFLVSLSRFPFSFSRCLFSTFHLLSLFLPLLYHTFPQLLPAFSTSTLFLFSFRLL